jgi:hypothetical protein
MIDAAETLAAFVHGREPQDLASDRMLLFAVVRAIEILGEAASHLSTETQAGIPDVPWASVVGMRNRLIHGYFDESRATALTDGGVFGYLRAAQLTASLTAVRLNERFRSRTATTMPGL